ncbi:MAG: PilZ domain-containing protein [Sphingomonadales bacterium]|nr:PilZ domain-containing protein [Sphingomonadales bacterium]
MGVAVKRLPSDPDTGKGSTRPLTRKATRHATSAQVVVLTTTGRDIRARLADLSDYGCNVRGNVSALRSGSFISLRLDGGKPVQALVRWVRDDAAGVEFLRPIGDDHPDWQEKVRAGDI